MKSLYLIVAIVTSVSGSLQSIKPGVYKEFIGNVAAIDNQAEIWIKIDLKDISVEIDSLAQFLQDISKICNRSSINNSKSNTQCSNFYKISEKLMIQLRFKFDQILAEKSKRGLMNIFGNGLKFLFGTMDSNDMEKISSKFDLLDNDNINTHLLQQELVSVIEKSTSNINSTANILNNQKVFLSEIQANMANIRTAVENNHFEIELNSLISDLKNSFVLMYQNINEKINDSHQMIIDLHNNV